MIGLAESFSQSEPRRAGRFWGPRRPKLPDALVVSGLFGRPFFSWG